MLTQCELLHDGSVVDLMPLDRLTPSVGYLHGKLDLDETVTIPFAPTLP